MKYEQEKIYVKILSPCQKIYRTIWDGIEYAYTAVTDSNFSVEKINWKQEYPIIIEDHE